MRGQRAFDILAPTGGFRGDLPDHVVDPSSLPAYLTTTATNLASSGNGQSLIIQTGNGLSGIGNYNTCIGLDGLLRVRPNAGVLTNNGAERLMGMGSFMGAGSVTATAFRFLAVGLANVLSGFYYSGGFALGTQAISVAQHTTADTPVRIIPWMQGGSANWLWVNQGIQFPNQPSLTLNSLDGLTVFNLDGGGFAKVGGFPLNAAADIISLTNRVVVVNSNGGGTNATPGRVQWSAVNDYTTWPAGAFQDLMDGAIDPIIAIKRTSQTSAVLFRTNSAWLVYGVAGTDAAAFAFERIVACDGMPGPASPAAVVEAEGQYYYMGMDGRVYNFNGSSITWISGPIDNVVRSVINGQLTNRSFALYSPVFKQVLFFFVPSPLTNSVNSTDPSMCVSYNLRSGNWDGLWAFGGNNQQYFSCGSQIQDFFSNGIVPLGFYSGILGCAQFANIARMDGTGGQDSGLANIPIPARYSSPLYRIDNLHSLLGDSIQLFLKQGYTNETITIVVEGFQNPYDIHPLTQASFTYDLYNVQGFASKFPPGPNAANNIRGNWVRVSIYSTNIPAQMAFGGGTIWVNPDEMGDSARTS